MTDMVNHPPHYTNHPSGVETIEITENLNFCLGNAVKYVTRHESKGKPVEDLEKAMFYLKRAKNKHANLITNVNAVTDKTLNWMRYESDDVVKSIVGFVCLYQAEGNVEELDSAIQHLEILTERVKSNV